jgi:very-short-patch-repair endonuclease
MSDGWLVLRCWEHNINKNPEKCIKKIARKIQSRGNFR